MNKSLAKTQFHNVCRTCLSVKDSMKSIYAVEEILDFKSTLKDILMGCASIQINEDDGMPENVCYNCAQEMSRAFIFKNLCEKSDAILREWLYTDVTKASESNRPNIQIDRLDMKIDTKGTKTNSIHINDSTNMKSDNKLSISNNNKTKNESRNVEKVDELYAGNISSDSLCYNDILNDCDSIYKGDVCNQTFKAKESLEDRQLNSETCMQKQQQKVKFKTKEKNVLPKTCNICCKTFKYHSNLVRHMLIHTGEKPFLCNICGKAFAQMDYLKIHNFIHTGEKPYKCNMCEKSFAAPSTLMTHIRTHTGERPHKCGICGKDFPQAGYLSAHIRTHTGEKPIECKICQKRFNQSGRLIIHMRIHSGEKPYECVDCGRCFATRGTLIKHTRTHTGERPYSCVICGQSFAQTATLGKHMKIHVKERNSL